MKVWTTWTSTVALAAALPGQPAMVMRDSTVDRSGTDTSVPFVPAQPGTGAALTVHVQEVLPILTGTAESVAVTVTLNVPAVVGVPEMVPVDALIDNPAGRPVAVNAYGAVPPVAAWLTGVIALPAVLVWLPGLPTIIPPVDWQPP